jgi:hypothetical protein
MVAFKTFEIAGSVGKECNEGVQLFKSSHLIHQFPRTDIYLWLYSPCGTLPLLQFLNLYTVGNTPWTGDQPVARPLPTNRITQTMNKRTQTSMPQVGFETTIPVFERVKTVHALGRADTMIGFSIYTLPQRYTNERVAVIIQNVKVSLL